MMTPISTILPDRKHFSLGALSRSRGFKGLYWPSSILLTIEVKKLIWGSAKYHVVLLQFSIQGLDKWILCKPLSPVSLGSKHGPWLQGSPALHRLLYNRESWRPFRPSSYQFTTAPCIQQSCNAHELPFLHSQWNSLQRKASLLSVWMTCFSLLGTWLCLLAMNSVVYGLESENWARG